MIEFMKNVHEMFWTSPFYLILYVVCFFILILYRKKMQSGYRMLIWYSIIVIVGIIYNPIFVKLSLILFFHGADEYVRIFQLLPMWYTIAYVMTIMITKFKKKMQYMLLVVLIVCLSVFGKTVFQNGWYIQPQNIYKINNNALEIANLILADSDDQSTIVYIQGIETQFIVGGSLVYGIRQYASSIAITQGFATLDDYNSWTSDAQENYIINEKNTLVNEQYPCHSRYVILQDDESMIQAMEKNGFTKLGISDNYVVMKLET